ncbi:alpha-aminoadipate reductase Lys1p [Pholiota molesta]|nr:alpha-aminoadipate reductase Lys1p [Pholiota molesta]
MADERLSRVLARLQNLPSISLPTDYPRPTGPTSSSNPLLKLVLYSENDEDEDDETEITVKRPSAFHLVLAAFTVLLHRYTGDTDIVVGSSSASAREPLILRFPVDPLDPYWAIVRRVQQIESEAEADALPYDVITRALYKDKEDGQEAPLFRVRFFDETDELTDSFIGSTNVTSDLTVFIRQPTTTRASLAPISLRILYNSLLFTSTRISTFIDQLSVFLRKVAANPLAPVGAVPLLTPSQKAKLPDPTADLDWCGWKGAITDVFSRNARQHPDRPCVVQSLPSKVLDEPQERVVYTYGAILKASNVLAHHLIKNGIQREEVVMVYAHRSVDLVVAVMAVLKAGATFSVIGISCVPASRQIIYLRVAQPRGLVVLKGAGKIGPSVREFLSDELKIKVEVPALEVFPDGRIVGGLDDAGEDILQAHASLGATDPNVALGPDSVGTLSFTSGSTGIPKGVRGRHFSLTHFFPWMGERFGLNENSKFTMLSGIAHDPIQRDMFTPLFLGAQLHVPTADDIGTPGRLAEWMADSEVTVTHLTPAMGQLLSAQATRQIPTLLNAFFVGDVLTKRDCLRLQALAANVRIINMYGTTETQRAVSYFAIPPVSQDSTFLVTQKDIMPAGEGMIDVQLLVVNRNDRNIPCAVGEVGEIYVRSGGLAEGYLDEDASAAKFVSNWFSAKSPPRKDTILHPDSGLAGPESRYWKGIRDRMYRSGDLGRYLPNGIVKIRGFRIELGEIDTHLSQHALVRENVTLVRRDKDEEKILVSYFVPLDDPSLAAYASDGLVQGMKRYRRLIKDIREHLKKKLPSYSIPTLFVPLSRMPLNPNGKIDKPALPFPDTAQASPTEITMQNIWAAILPNAPKPIPSDESFFDLGGHSILATRLIFEIRKMFVIDAPLGLIFEQPTIAGLVEAVDALRNGDLGFVYKKPAAQVANAPGADGKKPSVVGDYGEDYDERVQKVICLVRGKTIQQGLDRLKETWTRIANEADAVLHNGALVHWVFPYEKLRSPNVLGTITAINLASTGKPKVFVFVSSTSAIDTDHYVQLSESLARSGSGIRGVPESDDLEGAKSALKTEKLLFEAGKRGLRGHIVRPGYVVGDSRTAVTNTDDFIWRMVKGSYGFPTEPCEYIVWRRRLEQHVMEVGDNALFPLLHFVLDDLPTSTKSPELDDSNTRALSTVDDSLMGLYLAWLVAADFLPSPSLPSPQKALPCSPSILRVSSIYRGSRSIRVSMQMNIMI